MGGLVIRKEDLWEMGCRGSRGIRWGVLEAEGSSRRWSISEASRQQGIRRDQRGVAIVGDPMGSSWEMREIWWGDERGDEQEPLGNLVRRWEERGRWKRWYWDGLMKIGV